MGDWSLSGRNLDRMKRRWEDFLEKKFPRYSQPCLCELYDELIEWDGEVGDHMRLLLDGRRINLEKLRNERNLQAMIAEMKEKQPSDELLELEEYYHAILQLLDESLHLADRH